MKKQLIANYLCMGLAFALSNYANGQSKNKLRFDGIYATQPIGKPIAGSEILRFYEDGTVIRSIIAFSASKGISSMASDDFNKPEFNPYPIQIENQEIEFIQDFKDKSSRKYNGKIGKSEMDLTIITFDSNKNVTDEKIEKYLFIEFSN